MTADVTGSLFDRGSSVGGPIKIESDQIRLADLVKKNIIFGRPGTGKTASIVNVIAEYLKEGNRTDVLYLTYSRSMAKLARERLNLDKNTVGTIHSIISRRLGWKKSNNPDESNFLSDDEVSEFAEHYGIKKVKAVRPWDEEQGEEEEEWSEFMLAYDAAKNRLPAVNVSSLLHDSRYDPDFIAEKYEELKAEKRKHDYTDILTRALTLEFWPLDILVVDEAQDLTPLMWAIVEKIAAVSRHVIYAGDDLQSIFKFRGADPSLFLAQKEGAKVFHLRTSHRMPIEVKAVSDGVAERISIKEDVEFLPNGMHGKFTNSSDINAILTMKGPRFILCRTNYVAMQVAQKLKERDIIFIPINQRHQRLSPWSTRLINLSNAINDWPDIPEDLLYELLTEVPASMLVRGAKTLAVKRDYKQLSEMMYEPLMMRKSATRLFKVEPTAEELVKSLSIPEEKKELLLSHMGKRIGTDDVVKLDTYHSSKGLEAMSVGVVLDITKKVMESLEEDPDSELRNLYVALTRSKENLVVMKLNIGGWSYDV